MIDEAIALHQKGRLAEAAELYRRILSENPNDADALHLLGVVEFQLKDSKAALALLDRAVATNERSAAIWSNRGAVLHALRRFDDSVASYDHALAIKPDYLDALYNRGIALHELGRFADAIASYDRALTIKPREAKAHNSRGHSLQGLKRLDEAIASYDRALAIDPQLVEAFSSRGDVQRRLKRFDDAVASYDRALAITPDNPDAQYHRGVALHHLRRFAEAVASYDRALQIRPRDARIYNSRGHALQALERFDDAIASYDRAVTIDPALAVSFSARGDVQRRLKRYDAAIESYKRALAIEPSHPFLWGALVLCRMTVCDWQDLDDDIARLEAKVDAGEPASRPYPALVIPLSAAQQRACAEIYVREMHAGGAFPPPFDTRYEHDRIRIAYFSADFRDHAVAFLAAELFERHDRSRFEVTAFSFGAAKTDAMRARLEKSFDRFIDINALSDEEAASQARALEIDIAVDLTGFTYGSRPGVFARRAAPIQVNYLGYPGTMGAPYIDYLIADPVVIPQGEQCHYTEKVAYLPDSYQVNDTKRLIAERQFTRAACGLPERGFVFCSFNKSYKILPLVFDVWIRLLKRVPGSVLWLFAESASSRAHLEAEAQARGVDRARLVFAERMALSEHLARHRLADLFLDTLPYNGHTTASDALWAGLPVLTCLGETFAGRVAASLLHAIGLPELITRDLERYEALALELAARPESLLSLKQKLAANRSSHPLFNTALFTKHIEAAYMEMWQRHRSGLPPDHIHVRPQ